MIVFIAFIAFCFNVTFGQRVTSEEAILKAFQFANRPNRIIHNSITIDSLDVIPVIENGDTLLYFVKSADYTIIVPSVKCLPPVLGVIGFTSNSIDDYFAIPGTNYYLSRYTSYAKYAIGENNREILPQWMDMKNDEPTRSIIIEPLITTRWIQDESNDGLDDVAYNRFVEEACEDCPSNVSPLGCGAVAMGQVMNFYKYPILQMNKKANEQIDWCNMPESLYIDMPDYEKKRDAVAHLLRDCGLACDMSYCFRGGCQSFAWPRDVKKALVEQFSYSSDATLITRSDYPNFAWKNILIGQLIEKHPVIYANLLHDTTENFFLGYNGHIHICDGYNEAEGLFHFNLGWGGSGEDDWYNIDDFIVGNDNFNWFERAIINIYPLPGVEFCDYILALSNYYHFYYNIYGYSIPVAYSNVPAVANVLYSAPESSSVPASWRTIPAGATAQYVAHKEVILQPGFTAEYGSNFTARIEPCEACEERMVQMEMLTGGESDNIENITDTSGYEMRVFKSGDTVILSQPSSLLLYPNPTDNTITVRSPEKIENILILDNVGRPIFRWFIESNADGLLTLNVRDIPNGVYILQLTASDKKTHFGRFIKN